MSKHEIDIILDKLGEIHQDVKRINEEKIPKLDKRIAIVETKTKIWSSLAGVVGGALVFLVDKISSR